MKADIVQRQTPEEKEVEKKRQELAYVEAELAQRELDLATLRMELSIFEREYLRVVGVFYAELDALEAQITAIIASRNPADVSARRTAEEAQNRAEESGREASAHRSQPSKPGFTPTEDIKKLYREVARRVHPDLATDETDRVRRHAVMAEVNRAYAEGNAERLQAILNEQFSVSDLDVMSGVAETLIRLIRSIAQAEERIEQIAAEIAALQQSDLCKLRQRVEKAQALKRDLLNEMAADINRKIVSRRSKLADLTEGE